MTGLTESRFLNYLYLRADFSEESLSPLNRANQGRIVKSSEHNQTQSKISMQRHVVRESLTHLSPSHKFPSACCYFCIQVRWIPERGSGAKTKQLRQSWKLSLIDLVGTCGRQHRLVSKRQHLEGSEAIGPPKIIVNRLTWICEMLRLVGPRDHIWCTHIIYGKRDRERLMMMILITPKHQSKRQMRTHNPPKK